MKLAEGKKQEQMLVSFKLLTKQLNILILDLKPKIILQWMLQ